MARYSQQSAGSIQEATGKTVFYFFQRGSQYIRCEVRCAPNSVADYEIEIVEPGVEPRIEQYASSDLVHKRWLELQNDFQQAGWWGPTGRD